MSFLGALILAFAGAWLLAYVGASLMFTSMAVAIYFAILFSTGTIGIAGLFVATFLLLPVGIILNVPSLRRKYVSGRILNGVRAVLPDMTSTEREALEAGDVWWEGEMFRGKPDWDKLLSFQYTPLTDEEQAFLDNQVATLCAMIDDWDIQHETRDLTPEIWDYLRQERFFSMLIDKKWGGLGFSAHAQSTVVTRIATRSVTAAITVMVPNSLGPGELLMHYGTPEQQKEWLPGLAAGEHIPCFGLTGPEAGSDAGAIPDTGIVCMGDWEGKQVLGMRLTFSKRYITLAPVATVIGLALKLHDPEGLLGDADHSDYGITCALIPADLPGVQIGLRHKPCCTSFKNGPIVGEDIFVPIDYIIGGREMAGKGWRMLVECLSAGRGISLPALSAASGQTAFRMTGAYTRLRRQFKMPIGKFEGIQEAMGRIGGLNYTMEATRKLTASAVDNCAPSVTTALCKYHMTEMMRTVLTDAMDIHGGRGVMTGPRNYLETAYASVPVAITVEGANILTRNLMIFGQGAIRCHPYVFPEMEAARNPNQQQGLRDFDRLFFGHIGYSLNRAARAFTLGLTGSRLASTPVDGPMGDYYRQLTRMSAALAFTSDVTMGLIGGDLKRKERLSARLGDVLSQLYLASAVLKYQNDNAGAAEDQVFAQWAVETALGKIYTAFDDFFSNFPVTGVGTMLRLLCFPLGRSYRGPSDALTSRVAELMMEPSEMRDRLSALVYIGDAEDDPIGRMERAYDKLLEVEPLYNRFARAVAKGQLPGLTLQEQLDAALNAGMLSQDEATALAEFDALRFDAILTDSFSKDYIAHKSHERDPRSEMETRRTVREAGAAAKDKAA